MRTMASITAVALVLAAAAVAAAQAPPAPAPEPEPVGGLGFRDEVQVTVVNVDVYVRDGDGNPVRGLERSDFRILQNGVEMEISNFAELDREVFVQRFEEPAVPEAVPLARPDEPPPEEPEEVAIQPIWMVVYIDNENIHPLHRNRVLRQVREFVVENLRPPVQMMVVSYQRSLKVLQPFTADSRAVNSALREVTLYTGARVERDSSRRDLLDDMMEADVQDYGRQGEIDTRTGASGRIFQQIMSWAEEQANDLRFTLDAIEQVVGMLSGLPGRKSIVYVSSGLPMTPGIGLMHQYAVTFNDNSILSRRSRVDRTRDFRSLTSTANGQEVTFYTVDASGLGTLEGFSAEDRYGMDPTAASIGSRDLQSSLRYMADATGGLAIVNTNDISAGLGRIRDDLFSYYSVGYAITSAGLDRVHRIEVELPGHKGYELRYRQRYVEKSLETKIQERVYSALMVDLTDNPMDLELTVGQPAPATGSRWTAPVHLSFPLDRVALMPVGEEYLATIVLFVGARDADGRQSEIQRQEHEIRIPAADIEAARGTRFGIDTQLLLDEGRHRISIGLMDSITRQASYEQMTLSVP